jgi:hypothetical protein
MKTIKREMILLAISIAMFVVAAGAPAAGIGIGK